MLSLCSTNSSRLCFNPLLDSRILHWSKLKQIADDTVSCIKNEQERQIVARYARLTPSCKAGACTGQNSSMKNNKGH